MIYSRGQIYVGGSDGQEYDINASSGRIAWHTQLGSYDHCGHGVYSTASVWNGTVYVGGADNSWYALDALNGSIEWSVEAAPASENLYNWASSLVFDGYLYIGLASCMDNPLIRGGLLQVNLSGNHTVYHSFFTEPNGSIGSSVWASPAGDPYDNEVWIATGNGDSNYSDALIALNASTLGLVGYWHIPSNTQGDTDFGATPTLVDDAAGRHLVVDASKDGNVYALNRTNISATGSANPVWQLNTGEPLADTGYGGGRLYIAADQAGALALLAVSPHNGSVEWKTTTTYSSYFVGGFAWAGGVLAEAQNSILDLWDGTSGGHLRAIGGANASYAPIETPIIVDGQLFIKSSAGVSDLGVPVATAIAATSRLLEAPAGVTTRVNVTGGAPPYAVVWNFGDGALGSGSPTHHLYETAGTFNITATVEDALGDNCTAALSLRVWPTLSVVIGGGPFESETGQLIAAFSAVATGGIGPPYQSRWNLGDGSPFVDAASVAHLYGAEGIYNLTLETEDSIGGFANTSRAVNVLAPLSPTIQLTRDSGDAPTSIGAAAEIVGGIPPYSATWSFGDGSAAQAGFGVSHLFSNPGYFTVTLTVVDSGGFTHSTASNVLIAPHPSISVGALYPLPSCGAYPISQEFGAPVLGGVPPYSYRWSLDTIPLNATGDSVVLVLAGPGSHQLIVAATDSAGISATSNASFTAPGPCSPHRTSGPNGPSPSGGSGNATLLFVSVAVILVSGSIGTAVALRIRLGRRRRPSRGRR